MATLLVALRLPNQMAPLQLCKSLLVGECRVFDLSEDHIRKAFEKTRDELDITDGKLVLITEDYYDAAIAFGRDVFKKDEPITRAFQVKWTVGREKTWRSILQQKLSLMLLNEENGGVMAIRTMFIATDPSLEPQRNRNANANFVNLIRTSTVAVDPRYRKRGMAAKVFTAALKMIQYLGFDSVCVFGEGHSPAPKKLFERAGFECLFEMPHDQYVVDGKQVISDSAESTKVYGLKIQKS